MTAYTDYTPNFKCSTDGNGKGVVNSNIGLITYDEMVYAGGYYDKTNKTYYLYNDRIVWSMSPAGCNSGNAREWYLFDTGYINTRLVNLISAVRPVINLNSDVTATGTSSNPYVIQ